MIRVLQYEELDSTSLEARRLWQAGEWQSAPFAVMAAEQSGGMGREGRSWHSPRGGLWMTLAWPLARIEAAAGGLALVAGLAARGAIASLSGIEAAIKWPNDLLIGGRKAGGILCQVDSALAPPVVLIGIGVNANLRGRDLGEGLRWPATTLQEELGRAVDLPGLAEAILGELVGRLRQFEEQGMAKLAKEIEGCLAWRGGMVSVRNPGSDEELTGRLVGLDEEGRLVLEAGGERIALVSGEVRPAQG